LLVFFVFSSSKAQQSISVNFDYNEAQIRADARNSLDSFINQRNKIDWKKGIKLTGHCDARGSDEYNIRLSESRVQAVRSYLTQHQITDSSITSIQALGERQPLNKNRTETEMAINRRVEILYHLLPVVVEKSKPANETLAQQLKDTSVKVGGKLVLKNLNFEGGRHVLLPWSVPVLQELLQILKNSPSLKIAIEGHVCCAQGSVDGLDIDTKTYNLSVNRAKVVYDYLVDNGIDPARLEWDGYGNKYPIIYPEITESDRTTNRRVEIRIIQK
jgi:outer membrane protein OmpA-like peptidoglycan-associated protein